MSGTIRSNAAQRQHVACGSVVGHRGELRIFLNVVRGSWCDICHLTSKPQTNESNALL